MQKTFSLTIPQNVFCGAGEIMRLPDLIMEKGIANIAAVIDRGVFSSGAVSRILEKLNTDFTVTVVTDVPPEPEENQVRRIADGIMKSGAEMIVAIGGGSVMDTSKIISVMMRNPDYNRDLTDQGKITKRGIPLVCVPTSAGTGSEATPNAIILIPEKKRKVGVVHPYFLPETVILDPEMTRTLPPSVTAATGLDAFCHCIETYISKKTNPIARLFGLEGIRLISRYLRRAYADGSDMEAREKMLLAAFYGGVAITSSSTVAIHALSYPLGGTYRIAHGVSNAMLLPLVMEYNMDAIHADIPAIIRAMDIPAEGLHIEEQGQALVKAIFALCRDVNIPDSLRPYGVRPEDIDSLSLSASEVHRLLDQNPKDMSIADIRRIYQKLL